MASRFFRAIFIFLIVPVVLGVAGWQGWAWWSWATAPVSDDPNSPAGAVTPINAESEETMVTTIQVQIPQGSSGQQIGQDLEVVGLIRSRVAWNLWTRWQGFRRDGGYQAGTYTLSPSQSLQEIAGKIWAGEVVQNTFTVPEGWTREQMAAAFQEQGLFSAESFLAASQRIPREQYSWLPDGIPHLEGFLYPDTYQLPAEAVTAEAVVNSMLDRFEAVALPIYQQSNSRFSLLDWVALASIVEREAVIPDERSEIAAVFNRRLEENIPLGADPTVEYGLGVTQTPEQPLTLAQVRTPSPYNTYINPGLPPTPIASPGLASLEASLAPPGTNYLYFVARYDGTHVFSETLAEHEAAQARIRDAVEAEQGNPIPGS